MYDTSKLSKRAKRWLAVRRRAARYIKAETAEMSRSYGQVIDPYGILENIPPECDCRGPNHFTRAPRSKIWVWIGDLPKKVEDALWKYHRAKAEAGLISED